MWWTNAFRLLSTGHEWDAVLRLLRDRRECLEAEAYAKRLSQR